MWSGQREIDLPVPVSYGPHVRIACAVGRQHATDRKSAIVVADHDERWTWLSDRSLKRNPTGGSLVGAPADLGPGGSQLVQGSASKRFETYAAPVLHTLKQVWITLERTDEVDGAHRRLAEG